MLYLLHSACQNFKAWTILRVKVLRMSVIRILNQIALIVPTFHDTSSSRSTRKLAGDKNSTRPLVNMSEI